MENSIITGFFSITGLVVGFYFANKKHTSQKIYDQKLILIVDLYKQIIRLEFALKEYVHFVGAEMAEGSISKKVEALNKIKMDFQKFQHKFWEIEIILDESTIELINDFLKKYIEIIVKLNSSNRQQQQGNSNSSFDNWDKSFELISSDLPEIKSKLKEEFRKTLKIKS